MARMDNSAPVDATLDRSNSAGLADESQLQENATSMTTRSTFLARLAIPSLVLLYAAIWTIARPYGGLVHDARLYGLQTLARVQPEIFGDDLFLRFGSQDNFTLFPLLYAPLAGAIGIEPAAATLTFLLSAAWLLLGFLVARELIGARLALLSLGALIVVPGWYGAYEVFRIGEMFLSARLPAEVLAIGALLAYLRRRYWPTLVLCLVSMLIHPLMAIPMIGLLILTTVYDYAGARMARLTVLVAAACAAIATILVPTESVDLYSEWVAVLETRSAFLFPKIWRLVDWQYQLLILLTLVFAARIMSGARSRSLAVCGVWLGAAGVVLAAVGGALPDHPTLLRAQPWRWMWVPCLLAIIVLPALLHGLYRHGAGTPGRAAAVLMASAWLLADSGGGLIAAVALVTWFAGARLTEQSRQLICVGAWVTLAAVLTAAALAALQFAAYPMDTNRDPLWVQRAVNFIGPTACSLAIIAACWSVATISHERSSAIALVVLAGLALATFGPRALRNWTEADYSGDSRRAFEPLRSMIPERAEVLWPGNAIGTWLLLERRSYFSPDQLAGLLYSPRMTGELRTRAAALGSLASPDWWTLADGSEEARPKDLTAEILSAVCRAPGLDFVVSNDDVGGALSSVRHPGREIDVYLYDCHSWRPDQGDST